MGKHTQISKELSEMSIPAKLSEILGGSVDIIDTRIEGMKGTQVVKIDVDPTVSRNVFAHALNIDSHDIQREKSVYEGCHAIVFGRNTLEAAIEKRMKELFPGRYTEIHR